MGKDNNPRMSPDEARQLFEYRDGRLFWKVSPGYAVKAGMEAGTTAHNGYKVIAYQGRVYRAHHVVYAMFNGECDDLIDHINGDRQDNRPENLRIATESQNQWNRRLNANNKTGHKNVKWIQRLKKYAVTLNVKKKCVHVGVFADLELAGLVAAEARDLYHGKFARHQ
jgi:hypothetical protein